MKKKYYLYWGLFLTVIVGGCASEPQPEYPINPESAEFTVNEAREFFENVVQDAAATEPYKNILNPGEFTPQWDRFIRSTSEKHYCIQVPIYSQYRFQALSSVFENSCAHAYDVNIEQRLILLKNRTTGNLSMLIVSLIPDREYARAHKDRITGRALPSSDKDSFQGLVLGHSVVRGRLFSVERYEAGGRKERIYLYNSDEEYAHKMAIANNMLKGIKFLRNRNAVTRNDSEYGGYEPYPGYGDDNEGYGSDDGDGTGSGFWTGNGDGDDAGSCPYCFGSGCHMCNHTGTGYWPSYPGDGDPGDPEDDSDPGSSTDTGGHVYHTCGYWVASGIYTAQTLYCPKCRVHFWWRPE